jgi:hypothetical protein
LTDLLRAGLLRDNEDLHFCWPEIETKALLTSSGQILLRGETYDTPSGAGKAIRASQRSTRPDLRSAAVDGWRYWAVDRDGRRVTLGDLRDEYDQQQHLAEASPSVTLPSTPSMSERASAAEQSQSTRTRLYSAARDPKAPRVWVVRSGREHEFEDVFLSGGLIGLDWARGERAILSADATEIFAVLVVAYPGEEEGAISSWAHQISAFVSKMSIGDLVLTRRANKNYAVGEITGEPILDVAKSPWLQRAVRWMVDDLRADDMDPGLQAAIGAPKTVSSPRDEVDADAKIRALLTKVAAPRSDVRSPFPYMVPLEPPKEEK